MKIEQFYIVMDDGNDTVLSGPYNSEQVARTAMARNYSGFTSTLSIVKVVLEGEVK